MIEAADKKARQNRMTPSGSPLMRRTQSLSPFKSTSSHESGSKKKSSPEKVFSGIRLNETFRMTNNSPTLKQNIDLLEDP